MKQALLPLSLIQCVCILSEDDDHCKRTLCECDKAAAECFGKNNPLYNTKNKHAAVTKGISNTISKLLG